MAAQSRVCEFGWKAVEFDLPGVDGRRHTLASARGANGLLVMFICNHCPYVKAIRARIVRDCRELAGHGIGSIAIMSNDPSEYPEDSFENMRRVAAEAGFTFPYVLDATQAIGPGDRLIAGRLQGARALAVVVVNKVDAASRAAVGEQLAEAGEWDFHAYVPLSALQGENLAPLVGELVALLPEGPAYFPPGMVTDQPEELLVGELIREKFLARLREELPHSLAVLVEGIEEQAGGVVRVEARLVVERESQKGMIIGKGGALLREAGTEARTEIEALLGARVFLDLRVRVEKDWQRRPGLIKRLGM